MIRVKQLILLSMGIFLSACNSTTELSSKDVTTYVTDQYSGNPEIRLGENLKNAVFRMRSIALPKLKKFAQGQQVRLYVTEYKNGINSTFDSLPLGGNNNPVPTHAAYTVFKGSGFKIIDGGCPIISAPNDFQVETSIVSYDEDVLFISNGWEASADDDGFGSGTYDASDWLSNSNLVLLTQLKNCSNNEVRRSVYLPLTLISMNEANSFLLFNKLLGIYYSDSISLKASAQLDRDKASILGMMKIASEFAGLTTAEFDLAIYGVTSIYNEQTGILETYADPKFDRNFAHFIFSAEYFGDDKPEIVTIPFGDKIELKLRLNNQLPSLRSGVRQLNIKLEYRDKVIYQKSLI
ncbi:hypothetical protein CWB89_06345 [Pseudoalteromonas piscicida]|uniref:Uncharacterized protein n=1 Tax=Pseudoalteromonas piscicida TaxID=43662 RepID=A0AAQ2EW39_PSEO7|nr:MULTISPECIES: hypothetical protein [Pseudoalteromonas]KJY90363.1 hypothetical protein TW75_06920 [Pseudoalteromonas piscicida]TMN43608.1 hypothetical protein CWB95_05080 [Pseudoalteromonas piscicida]TMN44057.1 hypothetical protein CWB94_01530 [Pseudoalteromonas piscicida]TMN56826.1 hypothetical protein CWB92_01675 [Pseudoalteromonas piscicida]TMN57429.1 hypothetical protein CWB91_03490 [Pseudoalteromonas piscicida]